MQHKEGGDASNSSDSSDSWFRQVGFTGFFLLWFSFFLVFFKEYSTGVTNCATKCCGTFLAALGAAVFEGLSVGGAYAERNQPEHFRFYCTLFGAIGAAGGATAIAAHCLKRSAEAERALLLPR